MKTAYLREKIQVILIVFVVLGVNLLPIRFAVASVIPLDETIFGPLQITIPVGKVASIELDGLDQIRSPWNLRSVSDPQSIFAQIVGGQLQLEGLTPGAASVSACTATTSCLRVEVRVEPSADTQTLSGNVRGAITPVFTNGALIVYGKTISIIYRGAKLGFASLEAFRGLGYDLKNVVPAESLATQNFAATIKSAARAHPAGSWVSEGQTVYFVHEAGRIPIASFALFLNNGGVGAWIVPANRYDLNLPLLAPMIADDARLK